MGKSNKHLNSYVKVMDKWLKQFTLAESTMNNCQMEIAKGTDKHLNKRNR